MDSIATSDIKTVVIVEGRPVPTPRPRVLRSGHTYTPRRALEAQAAVAQAWIDGRGAVYKEGEPIMAEIRFFIEPPKSWSIKNRKEALEGRIHATSRAIGDLDNLAKTVLDGLTGIAYVDDSQVTELHVSKAYGTPARTEITLLAMVSDSIA